ncbi:MAG: DNA polymerase IV, partial [Phaeodactylibacter sp.]|nr:DNA polymerase IV [Phaeodactylibacter sp.]
MFERAILHLDLDAFFVSVEQLQNTALKGKPLIIGGSNGRGVVSSCSYEA